MSKPEDGFVFRCWSLRRSISCVLDLLFFSNYDLGTDTNRVHKLLKAALKKASDAGELKNTTGGGATGSFRINSDHARDKKKASGGGKKTEEGGSEGENEKDSSPARTAAKSKAPSSKSGDSKATSSKTVAKKAGGDATTNGKLSICVESDDLEFEVTSVEIVRSSTLP